VSRYRPFVHPSSRLGIQGVSAHLRSCWPAKASPPGCPGHIALAAAAADCRGCDLADLPGTQTVFGTGPARAWLALVGEQPGDVEDRRGLPFVGPAGKLLDRALGEVGLDRGELYVTNAVKHFRYRAGNGPRRIHQTPDARHVTACRPWLSAELNRVRPAIVVILGATAGSSLLGPSFRVTRMRGRLGNKKRRNKNKR